MHRRDSHIYRLHNQPVHQFLIRQIQYEDRNKNCYPYCKFNQVSDHHVGLNQFIHIFSLYIPATLLSDYACGRRAFVFQIPLAYRMTHTIAVVIHVTPMVTQIPQNPSAGMRVNICE